VPERDGEVGLADAWGSDQQDVGFLGDEPQCREVFDHPLVEAGLGGEVELLEGLAGGQL
jgi:hypothetical protein